MSRFDMGDHSKRNQYCQYHRDVSHTMEDCIVLKDEIEKLIREGYLLDYVRNGGARSQNDQNEVGPSCKIRTIFGGPHFARETRGAQNHYLREAKEGLVTIASSLDKRLAK